MSAPRLLNALDRGELPGIGAPTVGGVRLPTGRAWPALEQPGGEPVLWSTDSETANALALASDLANAFPRTGLWPCLWGFYDQPASYCQTFQGGLERIDDLDAEQVLRDLWSFPVEPKGEWIEPYTDGFPGLAGATVAGSTSNPFSLFATHRPTGEWSSAKIVLASCRRPADAITAIGLECGPEGSSAMADVALVSAVLRSWEDRFQAFLVEICPGGIILAVEARPSNLDHGLAVAAELYALDPGEEGGRPGVLRDLAASLVRGNERPRSSPHVWWFRWPS